MYQHIDENEKINIYLSNQKNYNPDDYLNFYSPSRNFIKEDKDEVVYPPSQAFLR